MEANKAYTAWGDLVEPFFDISVVNKQSGDRIELATFDKDSNTCPSGYNLYEASKQGLEQLQTYRGVHYSFASMGSIKQNTYYCIDGDDVKDPMTGDYGVVYAQTGFPKIMCANDEFGHFGKCISTNVPNFGSELSRCMNSSLAEQKETCYGVKDLHRVMHTFPTLPRPAALQDNVHTVKNKGNNETDAYCPTTHPFIIQDTPFSQARCASADQFGLVFNRFCDKVDTRGDTIGACVLRVRTTEQWPEEAHNGVIIAK